MNTNISTIDVVVNSSGTKLKRLTEGVRMVPLFFVRSALFAATKKKNSPAVDSILPSYGEDQIKYKGDTLSQSDLSVFLEICYLMDGEEELHITWNELLLHLGHKKNPSGKEYDSLKKSLGRLSNAHIDARLAHHKFKGTKWRFNIQGIISIAEQRDSYGSLVITINPLLIEAIEKFGYAQIVIQERRQLKSDFAKWLHAFYSTHENSMPIKLEKIRALSGIGGKEFCRFKQKLDEAITELVNIGWDFSVVKERTHSRDWKLSIKKPISDFKPHCPTPENPERHPGRKAANGEFAAQKYREQRAKLIL